MPKIQLYYIRNNFSMFKTNTLYICAMEGEGEELALNKRNSETNSI